MAEDSQAGNEIIPLNEETRVALPLEHGENEFALALPEKDFGVAIPSASINLNEGTFLGANFGPQTNTKVIEAHKFENSSITHHHVHHHYADKQKKSGGGGKSGSMVARRKDGPNMSRANKDEGCVPISEDVFMYDKKPLRKGTKIFEGYQLHVSGDKRPLAIKVIFPCEDQHVKEVKHLVSLSSNPNVVHIIQSKESHEKGRTLYIAMELCSSQNLQDYFNENREKNIPLDFNQTMSYTRQLVYGMRHIHRNKIIHRDMKPENVLLSIDHEQIKLADFGISKELRHGFSVTKPTNPGQGTDGYRAPETYNSDVISQSSDIFSLGLTMHSLWSNGRHPYGVEIDLLNYNIKKNKGRDYSDLLIYGPKREKFVSLLDRMLDFDPKNRPTIEEVLNHPFFNTEATLPMGGLEISDTETVVEEVLPGQLDSALDLSHHISRDSEKTGPEEAIVVNISCKSKQAQTSLSVPGKASPDDETNRDNDATIVRQQKRKEQQSKIPQTSSTSRSSPSHIPGKTSNSYGVGTHLKKVPPKKRRSRDSRRSTSGRNQQLTVDKSPDVAILDRTSDVPTSAAASSTTKAKHTIPETLDTPFQLESVKQTSLDKTGLTEDSNKERFSDQHPLSTASLSVCLDPTQVAFQHQQSKLKEAKPKDKAGTSTEKASTSAQQFAHAASTTNQDKQRYELRQVLSPSSPAELETSDSKKPRRRRGPRKRKKSRSASLSFSENDLHGQTGSGLSRKHRQIDPDEIELLSCKVEVICHGVYILDRVLENLDEGFRILYPVPDEEKNSLKKIRINKREKLACELKTICLAQTIDARSQPVPSALSDLQPDFILWLDTETLELKVEPLNSSKMSLYDPTGKERLTICATDGASIPIFSAKNYISTGNSCEVKLFVGNWQFDCVEFIFTPALSCE